MVVIFPRGSSRTLGGFIERQTGDEPALVALWFPLEKEGSAKISYIYIDIPGLTMTGNSICFPVQGRLET